MNKSIVKNSQERVLKMLEVCDITLLQEEAERIEIADFGLNELDVQGLVLITYVNNDRYCAKDLVIFPEQTCPEHLHPPVGQDPGKMETFRCRSGSIFLYVEGSPTDQIQATLPAGSERYYTVFHEVELHPGEQYTIKPGVKHWFQAGKEGAIISEFSSASRDEFDIFTDPRIARVPLIHEQE